jgi:hypothetical protein
MMAFPISAPVTDPQTTPYNPPPSAPVSSREATSSVLEPDTVTISPAAQQSLKAAQFADDGSDNQS